MAVFWHTSRKLLLIEKCNFHRCTTYTRLINYSAVEYDAKWDPRPVFFNKEIQSLLRTLTRVDVTKVFRRRKLGDKKLEDPEYKFMTEEKLQEVLKEASLKMEELLQIPPVVPVREPTTKILSKDPALHGLETSNLVFTDITFGVKDKDRLTVVREPDGTLKTADWDVKRRINQIYFPHPGRTIKPPRMLENKYLEDLLNRQEYEFILDNICMQYEPDDPEYQRIASITYQHLNEKYGFELLRSTRHFGSLVFFLVWNKNIDNLMLELIETSNIAESNKLLELFSKIHNVVFEHDGEFTLIEDYIRKYSNKKGALELGLQAYKDVVRQREKLERGIKTAHGISS